MRRGTKSSNSTATHSLTRSTGWRPCSLPAPARSLKTAARRAFRLKRAGLRRSAKEGRRMLTALVPAPAQRRIHRFVDEVFLPRAVTVTPGGPPDMVQGPPDASGWRPWRPLDSPVTDADIFELEAVI